MYYSKILLVKKFQKILSIFEQAEHLISRTFSGSMTPESPNCSMLTHLLCETLATPLPRGLLQSWGEQKQGGGGELRGGEGRKNKGGKEREGEGKKNDGKEQLL